jgi:hypothetical protein
MQELERNVRSIEIDGLLWGACKLNYYFKDLNKKNSFSARLVPLAYTIKKLQITCVVEDDKVDLLSFSHLFYSIIFRLERIFSKNVLWLLKIMFNQLILHHFKRFKFYFCFVCNTVLLH